MRRLIASCAVLLALVAPSFAQTKLSQIPAAASPPALTDHLVAVIGGAADNLVSVSQLGATLSVGQPLCSVGVTTCYFSSPNTTTTLVNRLFVGEVAKNGNTNFPMSPADWVESIFGGSVSVSQIATVSTIGGAGALGASRTSDNRTAFGTASPATIGIEGLVKNDDTVGGTPIAVAVDGLAVAASSIGITLGSQMDINSSITTVAVDPYSGVPQGTTGSLLLTSGFDLAISTHNPSAAFIIAQGVNTGPVFRVGGVCENGALATATGSGGNGVCLEMAQGQTIFWEKSSGAEAGEIWMDSAGNFNIKTNDININGTTAVSCGAGTVSLTTLVVTDGIVTHC